MRPASMALKPEMQSISVVLPAPLWPMRPRISPSRRPEVDGVDGGDAAEALDDVAALEHRLGVGGGRLPPGLELGDGGGVVALVSASVSASPGPLVGPMPPRPRR